MKAPATWNTRPQQENIFTSIYLFFYVKQRSTYLQLISDSEWEQRETHAVASCMSQGGSPWGAFFAAFLQSI